MSGMKASRPGRDLIERETSIAAPHLVPEILLHTVTEADALWRASDADLARIALADPFWAFAWGGGQALARYLLDHPADVRGLSVLDLGSGSGLCAIAAALAGAAAVTANDVDPTAGEAIRLNARLNAVEIDVLVTDLVGSRLTDVDVVLVGDLFYERPLAERVALWLARERVATFYGDPARGFLDTGELERVATYLASSDVDVSVRSLRETHVWARRDRGAPMPA
jgi:predicted nicotinamide N-methyase